MPFALGTARARIGKIVYGVYPLIEHPTGGTETIPVVLARGRKDGPCCWLTAGIHGNEHSGLQVLHELLTPALLRELRGTLCVLPALNPAGLRVTARAAYYPGGDPNRLWPSGQPAPKPDLDRPPPSALERAYARLFEEIRGGADALVDLHNAWIGSVSFVFRDRVLYRKDGKGAWSQAGAERLSARLGEMCAAYGHAVVNEYPAKKYLGEKLQRSTSGAALNTARIPALTMELGGGEMPDPAIKRAAQAGIRNILRWQGLLSGPREAIGGIPAIDPGFPCRRRSVARVDGPAVVTHLKEPGERVKKGEPLVLLRDIWGRPLKPRILTSEYDGWIVGRSHGIVYYPGTAAYVMAIRDDEPLVAPYPKSYFKA